MTTAEQAGFLTSLELFVFPETLSPVQPNRKTTSDTRQAQDSSVTLHDLL